MVSSKELISLRYMIVVRQRRNVCGWQALINLSVKHLADEKKTTLTAIIGKLQSLMGVREGPSVFLWKYPGRTSDRSTSILMRKGFQCAWLWTNFARLSSQCSQGQSPVPGHSSATRPTGRIHAPCAHLFGSNPFLYMRFLALKPFCVSVVGRAVRGSSGQGWRG